MAAKAVQGSIPILGTVLDGLMDKINGSIQNAINGVTYSVLTMEVEAGKQVAIAIQNAKEAYADSLNLTVDKVSKAITDKIDQLTNMVQIVEDNNKALLAQAAADAQQLVNTLPFSKQQPQLTTIAPQYVAISSQADTVLVKFSGNFPWSADKRYPTSFTMNGQTCPIFSNTTQALIYTVPVSAFTNTSLNKCAYVMGKLDVKWSNGWSWPLEKVSTAEYNTGIAVLPLSPGNITAYYSTSGLKRVEKAYSSPTYSFNGNSWYPQRWVNIPPFTVPPENGWKIDTSIQPRLVMHPGAHGNHTQNIISFDQNGVQVAVGLQCDSGHYMGIISFHIEFTEYQDQPTSTSRAEPITLKWGDSTMLQPQPGETIWKVHFSCFDGSENDFGPADTGNNYLRLINEGGTLRLIAQPPAQIQP